MKKYSLVSFYEPEKRLIVSDFGISWSQLEELSKIGVKTNIYTGDTLIETTYHISEQHDKSYFSRFVDYRRLTLIKNPFWRVLSIYIRYFLTNSDKNYEILSFKRFLRKIYNNNNLNTQENYLRQQFYNQDLSNCDDFFLCEDFSKSVKFWFDKQIDSEPLYNDSFENLPNLYNMNMETLSDFYDHESAEMVYTNNRTIFEKFAYSPFSYLDFHNPIKKIHVLHGKLTNYYER